MITKGIAIILIAGVLYVLGIFVFPEQIDTYGSKSFNTRVRSLHTEANALPNENPMTFFDKIRGRVTDFSTTASGYIASGSIFIDESKRTFDESKKVIDSKIDQVNQATDSVKKAYDAYEQAKKDLQNIVSLTGSSTKKE